MLNSAAQEDITIERIYFPPSMRGFQPLRRAFSTWVDHISFGYDIVEALRPARVVELGAYNGMSFFIFCQSMKEHSVDGVCYAVDTWGGDEHTGEYDESIYEEVRHHARENYRGISYLLRMLFNDAVAHFEAAIERQDRIEAAPFVALSRAELAGTLTQRAAPGDAERAAILCAQSAATADRLGLRLITAELERVHVQR